MIVKFIKRLKLPLYTFFVLLVVISVYRSWFSLKINDSGDMGLSDWRIEQQSGDVITWSWQGTGRPVFSELWNHFYFAVPITLGKYLSVAPGSIRFFGFILPLLVAGYLMSWWFSGVILRDIRFRAFTVMLIMTNTYVLMLGGGGQFSTMMACFLAFGILALQVKIDQGLCRLNNPVQDSLPEKISNYRLSLFRLSMISGILFSVQAGSDIRVTYMTFILCLFHGVTLLSTQKIPSPAAVYVVFHFLLSCLLPMVIAAGLHSYWLLPILANRISPTAELTSVYTSLISVKYFSFADFSHALSLLHPNWPENIFGKVYFMQPEFIVIPIIAFCALLTGQKNNTSKILVRYRIAFFTLTALAGAFLAKGTNPPFGEIYLWLFKNVPGFVMFRDPSKWYLLTLVGYAVLIPVALDGIYSTFCPDRENRFSARLPVVTGGIFLTLWILTIRQAYTGDLKGTYDTHVTPTEYLKLSQFVSEDRDFFRTFWVPSVHRFGYASDMHPAISGMQITGETSASGVIRWMNNPESQLQLARWGVRYIIIPEDSTGEIFLNDRKYDHKLYNQTVTGISGLTWLNPIPGWEKVRIFATPGRMPHFWIEFEDEFITDLQIRRVNPTEYRVKILPDTPGHRLVFSESFDNGWAAKYGDNIIYPERTYDGLNSFAIPVNKPAEITVKYLPQLMVSSGIIVSICVMITVAVAIAGSFWYQVSIDRRNNHKFKPSG